MHECRGKATVKVVFRFPIAGQFNGNYRSGEEELEDQAIEFLMSLLPSDITDQADVLDVTIKDYELLEEFKDED